MTPDPPNPLLAAYVTATAFDLRLTRPQIFTLCRRIDHCNRRSCKCDIASFVASGGALIRKGLVTHDGYIWTVTHAGEIVHGLLVEAGLCVHQWDDTETKFL